MKNLPFMKVKILPVCEIAYPIQGGAFSDHMKHVSKQDLENSQPDRPAGNQKIHGDVV